MMKALTEFLAAGPKTEQPKMTSQERESSAQKFADTMDGLLISATTGSHNAAAPDKNKENLVETEQVPPLIDDLSIGTVEPAQNAPNTTNESGLISIESAIVVSGVEIDEGNISLTSPQVAMSDLTITSTLSNTSVTTELVDAQGVGANTVLIDGSIDTQTRITAVYADTSAEQVPDATTTPISTALRSDDGADQGLKTLQGNVSRVGPEEAAELTVSSSDASLLTSQVKPGIPKKATSASTPTEITLNMVEVGRKFAGHLSETPNNTVTVSPTTASISSANTAGVAAQDVVGLENSLARTEGAIRGAELLGVTERLPLGQAPERALVDPRFEAVADRATVASSAAVVKTELTARQPVSFDVGVKLSSTEPQQFAGDMATHIRVLKSQSGGEVKLNLHPAELGRMSISVSTEGNETRVAFVVETSQARQAVETALPRLRDMLENAGLSLSDSDVSEQRNPQAETADSRSGSSREETTSPDGEDVSATTVLSVTVDPDRLVDTYI